MHLMSDIEIKPLTATLRTVTMLSEILIETVANGGSVSFMHPLDPKTANAFWDDAFASVGRGERIVLGAWEGRLLVGTVNCCSTARRISHTGGRSPS